MLWGLTMPAFFTRMRQSSVFWLWFYNVLLLLPSALISGDGLGKAVYPMVLVLALTFHYRRYFWLMLPFYLLAPFALYYEISYRVPPETSLWLTLLGSSATESQSYLGHARYLLGAVLLLPYLLLLPVFYRVLPRRAFQLALCWRLAGIALLYVPIHRFYEEKQPVDGYLSLYRHYKQSFPLNFVMGYPAAKIEINRIRALESTQQGMTCAVDTGPTAGEAQTVVLVLGESARRDRLGLFGYANDTSPEMGKLGKQLWRFSNTIATGFETTISVPTILTGQLVEAGQLPPSFLTAFHSAGFKTWWFSNQAQYGEYDSLVSAYAAAADQRVFLHQHSYSMSLSTVYDEALLPYLDQALQDRSTGRKLIVLHLYGSHPDFALRFPAAYKHFPDAYDNSILYTDHVLGEVVKRVQAQGGSSTVTYLADHGLNLGQCPGQSYHLDQKSDYEVPLLMWASPVWRAQNPALVRRLDATQDLPLTTETVMPALLTMGHVSCPTLAQQHSLFTEGVESAPRRVHTFGSVVAYDHSADDAQCHLAEQAGPSRQLIAHQPGH
jgi:heptose-I-phosphate ethanolaminephosphotransferase